MKGSRFVFLLQLLLSVVLLVATVWLVWPWPYRSIPEAAFFPTFTVTPTLRQPTSTLVPTATTITPTATEVPVVHVVQPGEVLGVIAKLYGVTVDSIMEANGIKDANLVQRGEKLVIPHPLQTPRVTAMQHETTPTPTVTSAFRDVAPVPLSPEEEAVFEGSDALIVLTWASTAALSESECFEVRFWCGKTEAGSSERFYTTTSTWTVPGSLYPEWGDSHCYWTVQVVYHARRDVALSPPSNPRSLIWH
ncbi:MAG TPA: LysM domain-containing protein [Anaerolineae bacterium]|nr:LysM domain-containing protein [Anaerolineae bacterium]